MDSNPVNQDSQQPNMEEGVAPVPAESPMSLETAEPIAPAPDETVPVSINEPALVPAEPSNAGMAEAASQPVQSTPTQTDLRPQVDGFSAPVAPVVSSPVPPATPQSAAASPTLQTPPSGSNGAPSIMVGGGDMTAPVSVASTAHTVPLGAPLKSGKKKWVKISLAVIVPLLVLGGGGAGAYFGYYMNPDTIWKNGMNNTSKGFTQLTSYLTNLQAHPVGKGTKIDGDFQLDTSSDKVDGTLSSVSDGKTSNTTLAVNAGVAKITVNARTFAVPKDVNPDIYVQVTGFKDLLGGSSVSKLDGKWITINHTLLDDLEKQSKSSTNPLDSLQGKDVDALVTSMSNTTNKYVFTSNTDNSVMTVSEKVGKETQDGRSVYHYKVTFDKNHVKSYVEGLHDDLQNSEVGKKLAASTGQSLDQMLSYSDMLKSIDNIKSDYKADVWMDMQTRLIHKIRFTDPNNADNYFDVGQNYTGGTTYPFVLVVHSQDPGHGTTDFSLGAAVNQKTNKVTFNLKTTTTDGSASDNGTATVNATVVPNNDTVNVGVPQNAESLSKVMHDLGLDYYYNSYLNTPPATGSSGFAPQQISL